MYDGNLTAHKHSTDDKEGFLGALEEVCEYTAEQPIFTHQNKVGSIREKYLEFSKYVGTQLITRYDFCVRFPEFFGLSVMGQAIAGMTIAARVQGERSAEQVSMGLCNSTTTQILLGLTNKGSTDSQLKLYESRVSRMEVILGLKKPPYSNDERASIEAFQNLATAFTYVPSCEGEDEPYFEVSTSAAERIAKVVNHTGEKEAVCPMRSKVEEVFCLLADSACRNEDLVPFDLSLGIVRPSGLIVPSHVS
jgi:hypothetical protein